MADGHNAIMAPMTVLLRTAPADCWSCGCETGILSSISLGLGEIRADCSASDFTDWPELMDELVAKLPATHGVGTIKPRASAAAGRSYMSNGCRHCDAIFGQHYEIHARYDETVAAAFEFAPSPRWRKFLEAQPD